MKSTFTASPRIETGQGLGCFWAMVLLGLLVGMLLFGCAERRPCNEAVYRKKFEWSDSMYSHQINDTNFLRDRLQIMRGLSVGIPYFSTHKDEVFIHDGHIIKVGAFDTFSLSVRLTYWEFYHDAQPGTGNDYTLGQLYEISHLLYRP